MPGSREKTIPGTWHHISQAFFFKHINVIGLLHGEYTSFFCKYFNDFISMRNDPMVKTCAY